jgi:hypothetical protein
LKGGLSLEENGEAGGEGIQQVSKLELIRYPGGEENLELGFGAPGLMGVTTIHKTRCWIATVFLFLTTFCLSLSTSDALAAAAAAGGGAAAAEGHSEKSASKKTDWDQSKSHHGAVSLKLMHREQVALALGLAVVPPAQQQLPQLVANAIARSKSRVRYLNSRVVAKLGLKNSHAHQFVVAQASAAASLINAAPPAVAVASASGLLSSPASGGGQEYFVSLKLGNPPQDVLVAVDTGSEISWVQCTPCVVCYNQILPIYDPNKSSSYTVFDCSNKNCHITDGVSNVCSQGDGTCAYAATYGDGSDTWGSLSSETFTMESSISSSTGSAFVAAQEVIFGCGRLNQGLFVGSSGLLGLDRGTFSFATQMGVSFSYCMIDRMKTPNATSSLVFGSSTSSGSATAVDQPASAFAYTSMLNTAGKAPGFYYVSLVGIRVGKQQLAIDFSAMELNPNGGGGTIIDSGTYISFLPEQVYLPLQDAILKQAKLELLVAAAPPWSDLIPGGLQTCFLLPKSSSHHKSRSEESGIPPVILQFEGNVDMELDFHNVIIGPFDPGTNELYCLAFVNSGPLQQPPSMCVAVIIGNVQQQNFLINFDLSNSRVGFKKTDCATAAAG